MKHFPISRQQTNSMDCGPSCLQMIAKYYGKIHSLQTLRELCQINEFGVSLLNLSKAAESIGFRCINIHATIDELYEAPLPCIVHWKQHHFVVVYKITSNYGFLKKAKVCVADPARGLISYSVQKFVSHWTYSTKDGIAEGIALLLEPSDAFWKNDEHRNLEKKRTIFNSLHLRWVLQIHRLK